MQGNTQFTAPAAIQYARLGQFQRAIAAQQAFDKESRASKTKLHYVDKDGNVRVNPTVYKTQEDLARARGHASRASGELEHAMSEMRKLEEIQKTRSLTAAEQRRYDTYSRVVSNKALLDPTTRKRLENLGLATDVAVRLAKKVADPRFNPTGKIIGKPLNRAVSQLAQALTLASATGFDRGANFTDSEQRMIGS